jgi:hypothetical protein
MLLDYLTFSTALLAIIDPESMILGVTLTNNLDEKKEPMKE